MQKESERARGFSRRDFLKCSALTAAVVAHYGWLFVREKVTDWAVMSLEIHQDLQEALGYSGPEDFYNANKEWLSRIEFGFNLSPDHIFKVFSAENVIYKTSSFPVPPPEQYADFIYDELNMRKGRIGIWMDSSTRLNTSADHFDWSVNLDSYMPWLMACANKGLEIGISAGHKSPRWRELHTPDWAIKYAFGNNIPHGHEIDADDFLGQFGLEYHEELLQQLMQNLDLFAYQIENEHRSPGPVDLPLPWRLTNRYVYEVIKKAAAILPKKTQIWLNAATMFDWPLEALYLLEAAQKNDPSLLGRLGLFTNYYNRMPGSRYDIGTHELFDTIAQNDLTSLSGMSLQDVWKLQLQLQLLGGLTELQLEPWYDQTKKSLEPGNSFALFVFSLIRNHRRAYTFDQLPPNHPKVLVCGWGTEEMWRHSLQVNDPFKAEHEKNNKLIQLVNAA